MTSSDDERTAPVRSVGTIFAKGTLTAPVASMRRPLMLNSRAGEASICASGTSTTRRVVPSPPPLPSGRRFALSDPPLGVQKPRADPGGAFEIQAVVGQLRAEIQ